MRWILMFSFVEGFMEDFNDVFNLPFNVDKSLELGELLGTSVTIEFNNKCGPEILYRAKWSDIRQMQNFDLTMNNVNKTGVYL